MKIKISMFLFILLTFSSFLFSDESNIVNMIIENSSSTIVKESVKEQPSLDKTFVKMPELDVTSLSFDNESLYPALFVMAKRGDIETLEVFLDKNLDINNQNALGMTALLEAVKANQYASAKFLISRGSNVKLKTKNGINVLRFAVENNNKKLVKLFLKKGVSSSDKDILGQTPLIVSIEKNYYKITKILLKELKGFDINMQDKSGRSLLIVAVENNDVDLVKTLIKKDINVWLLNNKNEDALSIAENNNNNKLIKLLKKNIKDYTSRNPKVENWVRNPGDKTKSNS